MNSPIFNAQYLPIDLRLVGSPEFLDFARTPAWAAYLCLMRYIWRSSSPHPIPKVDELRRDGYLVSTVGREKLAELLGYKHDTRVSKLMADLESLGLIERVSTGRQAVYVMGRWRDESFAGDGSYVVEILFLNQRFGGDRKSQIRLDEEASASDVSSGSTSEVQKRVRQNGRGTGESTSEVFSESTSEVPDRVHQAEIGADVLSESTSDVSVAATHNNKKITHTHMCDRKGAPLFADPGLWAQRKLSPQQEKVRRLGEVFERHGREPPSPAVLGQWLTLADGDVDLVEQVLERVAARRPDVLADGYAYLRTAILNEVRRPRGSVERGGRSDGDKFDAPPVVV